MSEKRDISRSELVRLRREQEHARQMERASKITARPLPVTARAKQKSTRKPVQNARRRYQIAVTQSPNAPARTFNIPRPHFGWRWLSFVLIALIGTSLYYAFTLPGLRVTEAKLTGSQLLSQAEINSVLNISGQPIFLLTPSDLETRLRLNYPELVSVRVEVSLPNLVSVDVTERQPVIRWEQGGGYTWVAEDGIAFRPHGELGGLIPVVALSAPPVAGSGPSISEQGEVLPPAPFISADMVQALKGLASHVPQGASVLYDKDFGFGWNDPRGWRVYFGVSAGDVELKIRVYEAMVGSLTQKGIRPALINVMYPTAPYYRMSQ